MFGTKTSSEIYTLRLLANIFDQLESLEVYKLTKNLEKSLYCRQVFFGKSYLLLSVNTLVAAINTLYHVIRILISLSEVIYAQIIEIGERYVPTFADLSLLLIFQPIIETLLFSTCLLFCNFNHVFFL